MDRLSAWFSRLSPRAGLDCPSDPTFDDVDRYFLVLRIGSALAAAVWLWTLAAPARTPIAAIGVAAFVGYSLTMYLAVWRNPRTRSLWYLAVLLPDLAFLGLICTWSADQMSGVYLAFYLLIALHAFYFGMAIGVAAASVFAVFYTALYCSVSPHSIDFQELVMRLAFAFYIAVSLAFLSRHLRSGRIHLKEVNRQLEHRNRILEQAYRHLSLGRLAGDVAHNINNPAAVILSTAELLRRRAERDGLPEIYRERFTTIVENAFRIGQVVRSIVALEPKRDGQARNLDLTQVADSVVPLFESSAVQKGARIERRLTHGLRVHSQESALRDVIVNLLSNALDAVDTGGVVIVETRPATEPHMAELLVHDNGHGIRPEHLDKIFSPFFSTKHGGDLLGVGLGLSLSLAIVRRLGGTMGVQSDVGKGAIFTVVLPVASRSSSHGEAAA